MPKLKHCAAITLLVLASIFTQIEMLIQTNWPVFVKGWLGKDEVSEFERSLQGAKSLLPHRTTIGYLSDLSKETSDYGKYLFLTQYSLIPVIVLDAQDNDLIVAYMGESPDSSFFDDQKLNKVKDFENNIMLLEPRQK